MGDFVLHCGLSHLYKLLWISFPSPEQIYGVREEMGSRGLEEGNWEGEQGCLELSQGFEKYPL